MDDGNVVVRHPVSAKALHIVHTFKHAGDVQAIAMNAGWVASGGNDKMVIVHDLTTGEIVYKCEHAGWVYGIAMNEK